MQKETGRKGRENQREARKATEKKGKCKRRATERNHIKCLRPQTGLCSTTRLHCTESSLAVCSQL